MSGPIGFSSMATELILPVNLIIQRDLDGVLQALDMHLIGADLRRHRLVKLVIS
jgi:hypothetical protein